MKQTFVKELEHDSIYFKYARGESSRSGKEFHLFHEIILFLGGEAELISETVNMKLKPNTLIFVPRETYHQLLISGDGDAYFRCVINFNDDITATHPHNNRFDRLGVYEVDGNINYLFDTLITLAQKDIQLCHPTLLRSLLDVLLYEITLQKEIMSTDSSLSETTEAAIKYIEENLTAQLNVEAIADACCVSPSTLSHIFKNEMQISVYRFCLQKKLLLAHDIIAQGTPAMTAAIECGFNDYSGFYKQYKRMFGFSPSEK